MSAMPATMAARARPFRRRFVSWKNFAPSRNVITTENRRMSDPTEIGNVRSAQQVSTGQTIAG